MEFLAEESSVSNFSSEFLFASSADLVHETSTLLKNSALFSAITLEYKKVLLS